MRPKFLQSMCAAARLLLPPEPHRHDYQMVFDTTTKLDFRLVCRCGDEAPDMTEALRRMRL